MIYLRNTADYRTTIGCNDLYHGIDTIHGLHDPQGWELVIGHDVLTWSDVIDLVRVGPSTVYDPWGKPHGGHGSLTIFSHRASNRGNRGRGQGRKAGTAGRARSQAI